MLRLIADENLIDAITRGILRRNPKLDIVRVQDVGLAGADDPAILVWAARAGRVLVTNDLRTMPRYAYQRVIAGEPMPGVFIVPQAVSIARAIEDLLLLTQCSAEGEWEGQVLYLPL